MQAATASLPVDRVVCRQLALGIPHKVPVEGIGATNVHLQGGEQGSARAGLAAQVSAGQGRQRHWLRRGTDSPRTPALSSTAARACRLPLPPPGIRPSGHSPGRRGRPAPHGCGRSPPRGCGARGGNVPRKHPPGSGCSGTAAPPLPGTRGPCSRGAGGGTEADAWVLNSKVCSYSIARGTGQASCVAVRCPAPQLVSWHAATAVLPVHPAAPTSTAHSPVVLVLQGCCEVQGAAICRHPAHSHHLVLVVLQAGSRPASGR